MSHQPLDMRACAACEEPVAGRYFLTAYLDEGGFGAVYRARHYAYGMVLREVAIKIAKRPMSDAEARRVFADALVMAKVQEAAPREMRDRFVTVHDAGTCAEGVFAGRPYIVMEYVAGGSLKGSMDATGEFPLDRAAATFDQILEAMACVHAGKFVHRDLKPSNILVVRHAQAADTIKVTDFGLAQHVDTLLGWIDSGGDLAHLAPESFDLGICSAQTDVYMLGLIFYEMLTGSNPFASVGGGGAGKELQERHMRARQAERFELLEKNEQIARRPALGAVIRRALSADPKRRYETPADLKFAWDRAKRDGPDVPPPPTDRPWDVVLRKLEAAEAAGLRATGSRCWTRRCS